jgi:hypothetical protein
MASVAELIDRVRERFEEQPGHTLVMGALHDESDLGNFRRSVQGRALSATHYLIDSAARKHNARAKLTTSVFDGFDEDGAVLKRLEYDITLHLASKHRASPNAIFSPFLEELVGALDVQELAAEQKYDPRDTYINRFLQEAILSFI